MNIPWISISIAVLIVLLAVVFFVKKFKKQKKLTPFANLGFIFIIAGIIAGAVIEESRVFAYSLFSIGIILAVVDTFLKKRKK